MFVSKNNLIIVDSTKIFDVKSKPKEEAANKEDLESVKKMLTDELLNEEPPKVDKPTSIADKVLKALHSQQQDQQRPVGSPDSISEKELEQIIEPVANTQEEKILKPTDQVNCMSLKKRSKTRISPKFSLQLFQSADGSRNGIISR